MSTNFYAYSNICKRCGQDLPEAVKCEEIHLGKSSVGWQFILQANGYKYYKNWKEMKGWLVGKVIVDEYEREVSLKEFAEWVENRKDTKEPHETSGSDMKKVNGYKFYDCDFC